MCRLYVRWESKVMLRNLCACRIGIGVSERVRLGSVGVDERLYHYFSKRTTNFEVENLKLWEIAHLEQLLSESWSWRS